MPPFKLEALKYNPRDKRVSKMLYCKKEYNKKVKITNWNMNLEYQPIDTNPYNEKCFRLHNSHYDRLGTQDVINPISETHESLRNGVERPTAFEHDPHKYMINVYTFTSFCENFTPDPCSEFCPEYITTMQKSYEAPYPNQMKGLGMAVIIGNQNKQMANKEECKFLDDSFTSFTRRLQDVKGFRQVSFNPYTGMYTDGAVPK